MACQNKKQIERLLKENECLRKKNFEKEHGESYYDYFIDD